MICARTVFRCFKRLERAGDRFTGAAGPVFVALATGLFSVGLLSFVETIMPTLPHPWLTVPFCTVIAFNLLAHYYFVCTIPPGFVDDPPCEIGSGIVWASPCSQRGSSGVKWSEDLHITKASVNKCKRCGRTRPERSHHCRICNRCVLKYDHHCPVWINQCVGLHNDRHFMLFLVYTSLGTLCYSAFGVQVLLHAMGFQYIPWNFYTPEPLFICLYILSAVMCLAVSVMGGFHLLSIISGETSVEGHDHEHYRMLAKTRGEAFINSYDLGKLKNLQLFFNIGANRYPLYTLFIPFRVPPYTDGRSWARKAGYENHAGVKAGEEVTDSDDD